MLLQIGHHSRGDTGVSVAYFGPRGAVASVDVRGGGPGTRETDLLEPHNTVERVHAIVLAGGSAFGLAAADGVMRELAQRGVGFPVFGEDKPGPRVPIVPAVVIFDLLVGPSTPTAADGAAALADALNPTPPARGNVGAGCGATVGRLRGGCGFASRVVDGQEVEAFVVANPVGEVIDPASGRLWASPERPAVDLERFTAAFRPSSLNTTIGVVATSAPVTKAQAKRLALAGHDGIARAIRPAHSPLDGDTLFGVSTAPEAQESQGVSVEELSALCAAAAEVVQDAIVDAVVRAEPGYGLETYSSLLR